MQLDVIIEHENTLEFLRDVGGQQQSRRRPSGGRTIIRDHREDSQTPPTSPDISWQPTPLTPVFYGTQDHDARSGAPGPLRVFYPSLDGAVRGAPITASPRRYPLILFLHGNCNEDEHYKIWYRLPATLARSGYVVIVPDLPSIRFGNKPDFGSSSDAALVNNALTWVRNQWEHHERLTQRELGIIGHSFGALLGGILIREILQTRILRRSPYMSLSGVWRRWWEFPLNELRTPSLYVWGTGLDLSEEMYAQLVTPEGEDIRWSEVPAIKHQLIFHGGHHWDYVRAGSASCEDDRGPCDFIEPFMADIASTFFARYMPPPDEHEMSNRIGNDLIPPPLELTREQEFFAGNHFSGFNRIGTRDGCSLTHRWELPDHSTGSVTIP
jgi:hypothetical protein